MKKMMMVLAGFLAFGLLLAACATIDYGEPTYSGGGNLVIGRWIAFADYEGEAALEEVYYFFDNGEFYMHNYHPLKDGVAETGTWTGSLEPGGEVVMTVLWYQGGDRKGDGGLYGEITYKHLAPPFTYTAEISMDGETLTAERWDYALKNEYGFIHSGATHKDYILQLVGEQEPLTEEEEEALISAVKAYYFAWMDARNN
ncbi:MAG: hypothetical protein FWG89_02785 [Treponema sp.]|nr:hypothetical protein [Treponema sp.]